MQSSVFRLQAENTVELPLDFATRAQPDPLNRWQATPGYSAPDVKDRNGSVFADDGQASRSARQKSDPRLDTKKDGCQELPDTRR